MKFLLSFNNIKAFKLSISVCFDFPSPEQQHRVIVKNGSDFQHKPTKFKFST